MSQAVHRPNGRHDTHEHQTSEAYEFGHSRIILEGGPVEPVARIEKVDGTEQTEPLPAPTVDAIREVGSRVR